MLVSEDQKKNMGHLLIYAFKMRHSVIPLCIRAQGS